MFHFYCLSNALEDCTAFLVYQFEIQYILNQLEKANNVIYLTQIHPEIIRMTTTRRVITSIQSQWCGCLLILTDLMPCPPNIGRDNVL